MVDANSEPNGETPWFNSRNSMMRLGAASRRCRPCIGLKGGAGTEQADPFQIFAPFRRLVWIVPEFAMIDVEQSGGGRRALDEAAHLDECQPSP